MNAEFFDIFGIAAFVIVTAAALSIIRKGSISRPFAWILLAVGLLGLAVDVMVVTSTYLLF